MLKILFKSNNAPCCQCDKAGAVLVRGEDTSGHPFMGMVCWEHLLARLPVEPVKENGKKRKDLPGQRLVET